MRLWRRTSSEVAGAWRSFRYDLGRRPFEPPADGPDVTSTGMSTFGGQAWWGDESASLETPSLETSSPERGRPPVSRAAAVSALGLLTVLGTAGAYLVVVNGLVPVRDEMPAAAGTYPAVSPAVSAESGLGPSVRRPRRHLAPAGPVESVAPVVPLPTMTTTTRPVRTLRPTNTECRCGNPPVPTPTAPGSAPSPTPSVSSSPSASPSDSDPSGTPDELLEPSIGWRAGHHRRHH